MYTLFWLFVSACFIVGFLTIMYWAVRVMYSIHVHIRYCMHYGEWPSYELVKEKEVKDEYKESFTYRDYQEIFNPF